MKEVEEDEVEEDSAIKNVNGQRRWIVAWRTMIVPLVIKSGLVVSCSTMRTEATDIYGVEDEEYKCLQSEAKMSGKWCWWAASIRRECSVVKEVKVS